jgi:GDP-L-fucose synthase
MGLKMLNKNDTILITGSNGMVGKNLVEKLRELNFTNLLLVKSKDYDLRDSKVVDKLFSGNKIDYVFHLAAKVGGIQANILSPAEFLYDNLLLNCNVVECAKKYNVKKLINMGSSCIYPKDSEQPIKEEYLLTGLLEPTNEGYAIGKIAGLKLCEYYNKQYNTNFLSLMFPNIYGKYDTFNSDKSHVVSALISKIHNAKMNNENKVTIWGDGNAMREFIYVDDVVDILLFFMENIDYDFKHPFINTGTQTEVSIKELASIIKYIIQYDGKLEFDKSKPNGMLRKCMDSSKMFSLGYAPKVSLVEGLKNTYNWWIKK